MRAPYYIRKAEIRCTFCGRFHVDREEWAHKPHHTHLCEHCDREFEFGAAHVVFMSVYFRGVPPFTIKGRARALVHKAEDALAALLARVTSR